MGPWLPYNFLPYSTGVSRKGLIELPPPFWGAGLASPALRDTEALGWVRIPHSSLERQNDISSESAGYCIAKKKRHGDRGPGNSEGPFLRASYDEYAAFSDLLGYLPRSEKPYSPEADDDAPRAMVYFPAKHLFYILTLRKCAQLATCPHLLSPFLPPLQIAFLFGRARSFLS